MTATGTRQELARPAAARHGAGIARLDLRLRRRSTIGYSVGMALYTLVVVALYPSFKSSTGLDELTRKNPTIAALFGITGSLTSPAGWLSSQIYANFLPLLVLLLGIGYGAAALAGQDEDGTLGPVLALPMRRDAVVAEKAVALVLQELALVAATAVVVLAGRGFDLTVPVGNVVAVSATSLLLGVDFGFVAMAVGAATGRRGTAIGVAAALAAASFLLASLAPVVSWIRPARYASLFYWSVLGDQIGKGVTLADAGVLVAVGVVALAATVVAFRRTDVR